MKKALILIFTVFWVAAMFGCDQPAPASNGGGCNGGGSGNAKCPEIKQFENALEVKNGTPPTGPYEVVIEGDAEDLPQHTIFRPVGAENMPILAWGEGGCVKYGIGYAEMMMEVASYGIVVIADGKPDGFGNSPGTMMNPVGDALTQGIDYAIKKNSDPCSPLYKKVDTKKVAVSGQSCGGLQAIAAAADPRVTVTFIMSSGLFADQGRVEKLPKIHTPIIYLNGGSTDVAYAQATKDIDYLKGLAAKGQFEYPILWANKGIGHMADILQDNGGTFGTYLKDWLVYQFFGDGAEKFEGDACGYCQDKDHESQLWTLDKFNGAK